MSENHYIAEIHIDEDTLAATSADVEHERRVAIFDLCEENEFVPVGSASGPYKLTIGLLENKLVFDVSRTNGAHRADLVLRLASFNRVIKDYFLICESYYEAIRTATPPQIEAIDMGRRGLHNEGTRMLQDEWRGKVEMDFQTARRFFTLICALYRRGAQL